MRQSEAPRNGLSRKGVDPFVALITGVLTISTAGPIIRAALETGAPPLTVATLRLTLASIILTVPAWLRTRGELASLSRKDILMLALSGILLAAHFGSWISSFAYTSVMSSVVLVSTVPIWIGIAAPFLLGERNSIQTWAGISVALAGTALIGLQGAKTGSLALRGNLLALTGAILVAGYLMIGRRLRERLSLLGYIWLVYGTAAIVLLLWTGGQILVNDFQPGGFAPMGLLWIALLAVGPQLIGHTAFNYAIRHVPAAIVSLDALGETVGATILAALFFDEIPSVLQLLGALLILAGIVVGSQKKAHTEQQNGDNPETNTG